MRCRGLGSWREIQIPLLPERTCSNHQCCALLSVRNSISDCMRAPAAQQGYLQITGANEETCTKHSQHGLN